MTFPNINGSADSVQTRAPLPSGSSTGSPPKVRVEAPAVPETPQQSASTVAQADSKQLEATVEKLRQFAAKSSSNLSFSVDHDTGKAIVRVTDQETGQLIRQIPSQEMMELAKSIDQMRGILIKKQA